MEIIEILENLSAGNGLTENNELDFAYNYLARLTSRVQIDAGGNVIATFEGKDNTRTILLDAHIDKIGFVVTNITDDGFLRCSASGGIDYRVIAAQEVSVYGKEVLSGVIQTLPPHLVKSEEKPIEADKVFVDVGMSADRVKNIVRPGDFVSFKSRLTEMNGKFVTAPSLDNKAGVTALLSVAERISKTVPPVNVAILLSIGEELGCRGAKTGAFKIMPNEAIAVDVSFGDDKFTEEQKCGKLGAGAMIALSPSLSRKISNLFIKIAEENEISFQYEAIGGITSTNADVIGVTGEGVPTGLLSIPLRNMHTPSEVISLNDIKSVSDIIFNYIIVGGLENA